MEFLFMFAHQKFFFSNQRGIPLRAKDNGKKVNEDETSLGEERWKGGGCAGASSSLMDHLPGVFILLTIDLARVSLGLYKCWVGLKLVPLYSISRSELGWPSVFLWSVRYACGRKTPNGIGSSRDRALYKA